MPYARCKGITFFEKYKTFSKKINLLWPFFTTTASKIVTIYGFIHLLTKTQ